MLPGAGLLTQRERKGREKYSPGWEDRPGRWKTGQVDREFARRLQHVWGLRSWLVSGVCVLCDPGLLSRCSFPHSPSDEIPHKQTRNCLLLKLLPYVLIALGQICISKEAFWSSTDCSQCFFENGGSVFKGFVLSPFWVPGSALGIGIQHIPSFCLKGVGFWWWRERNKQDRGWACRRDFG